MRKRPGEQAWKKALTVVALAATAMALYLQIFERRATRAEARLAAVRLEDALAESRTRLVAEILTELRAELRKESTEAEPSTAPMADTILRRLEPGGEAGGALGQALGGLPPQEALLFFGLHQAVRSLGSQTEEANRSLRLDLEELRAATLRESDLSFQVTNLLLVAVACLLGRSLPALWRPGRREGEEGSPHLSEEISSK